MFDLFAKKEVRENVLLLLFKCIKPSTWILVSVVVSFYKFANYGVAMYVGEKLAAKMTLPEFLRVFLDRSVEPWIASFVLALFAEAIILKPLFVRYVVYPRRG